MKRVSPLILATMPLAALALAGPALAGPNVLSTPDLGKAEGRCRADEPGPAILVEPAGLKDRAGLLKLEVYPANDYDFLRDDNLLINEGKVFRRVEVSAAATGPICVRVPGPGAYALVLLHDRDSNRKFGFSVDGVGFSGNPHLGWSKPKVAGARIQAGAGITHARIVLNYRRGLGMAPL